MIKFPKFIKPSDTIEFVAPSFGAATEPYITTCKASIKTFEKLGYKTIIGPNVFLDKLPYLSNTPEKIGREFMEAYKKANCLISVGGGEMQIETLPYIDFELIKKSTPKWFVGFSDNTNYCFPMLTISETASIYGFCAGAFGMYKWHQSIQDCYDLLTGKKDTLKGYPTYEWGKSKYRENHPRSGYHLTKAKVLHKIPNKNLSFEGRLIGGNLDIILMHIGTRFDNTLNFLEKYKDDGFIWALEACDLNSLSIRRAFIQLKEAGWFKYCKGFLIGRPKNAMGEELFGIDRFSALEPLKTLNVPIVADFDFGHIAPTMPLIIGSYATVKVKGNDINVKMECK